MRLLLLALATTAMIPSSGCGLLFGNVKPVEGKSRDYEVMDLSRELPGWEKLPPEMTAIEPEEAAAADEAPEQGEVRQTDISDLSFRSLDNGSIISLNSACRPSLRWDPSKPEAERERSLRDLTHQLLLGISNVKSREEKIIRIQEAPALQTTITGRLGDQPTQIRTVVVRQGECIYDLMYVSGPRQFARHEPDFTRFVASLRLRR